LNILIASSEVVPFSKTGGLADVVEALPRELANLGHQPVVFTPAYRCVRGCGLPIDRTEVTFTIRIGSKDVRGRLLRSHLRDHRVPVYLVEQDDYYDRDRLYGTEAGDFADNCERYVFFCRAVLQAAGVLGIPFDILHCNDWQTGLMPAYLRIEHGHQAGYDQIAALFTIHNMAYQGQFWHWDMLLTGLDWKYFNWHQMEFHGHLNLLKTGIVFSDAITTVSPQYASEIQNPPFGCKLEGVLRHRRDVLSGILNGVNYDIWDPAHDPLIETPYDAATWAAGKAACKAALQRELGLPVQPRTPLVGLIGRLADQKGWDLVAEVMQQWVAQRDVQWVILGAGDEYYIALLRRLSAQHPAKVVARLEFSDPLAHRIEAGADIFLMPSRYEPCGLNQMYSLKYGAVPVVHRTGGLADTIVDATSGNLAADKANGFSFATYDAHHLDATLTRAVHVYINEPRQWARLVTTGMRQDWSWTRSARQYVDLYSKIAAGRRGDLVH